MNLTDANKILDCLKELSIEASNYDFGPAYECAKKKKAAAIKLIQKEIKILKKNKKAYDLGVGHLDSLSVCEHCGEETFIWRMAGGGECKNPNCDHAEIYF